MDGRQIEWELGGFRAGFRPSPGGNLVRLLHLASGVEILRTPPDDAAYLANPVVWGLPVLMPPNRIRDGRFVFRDRVYQLPVNEAGERHNHLHGLVLHRAWELRRCGEDTVEMRIDYPGSAAGEGWMHSFAVKLLYHFSRHAVLQEITVQNTSPETMPLMLGFHSAFRLPDGAAFRLAASRESRTLDPVRKIVNGGTEQLPDWRRWRTPVPGEQILGHCAMDSAAGEPEFEVRYPGTAWQLRYVLYAPWREWVIWNGTGLDRFLCVEPQSCRIDAMNLPISPAEAGVIELAAGASRTFRAVLAMERRTER